MVSSSVWNNRVKFKLGTYVPHRPHPHPLPRGSPFWAGFQSVSMKIAETEIYNIESMFSKPVHSKREFHHKDCLAWSLYS